MVAAQGTNSIGDLRFTFRDATNLETPTGGHIDALTITFRDPDHITQEWSWLEDGKVVRIAHDLERRVWL